MHLFTNYLYACGCVIQDRGTLSQSELQILDVPVCRLEGLQADCILMSGAWEINSLALLQNVKVKCNISNGEWVETEHPQAEANSLELCILKLILVHAPHTAEFELKWAEPVVLLYNN